MFRRRYICFLTGVDGFFRIMCFFMDIDTSSVSYFFPPKPLLVPHGHIRFLMDTDGSS